MACGRRSSAHGASAPARPAGRSIRRCALSSIPPSLPKATAQDTEVALGDSHVRALRWLAASAEGGLDGAVGHPDRVGTIALAIGRHLGLDPFAVTWLGHAALRHDIRKLAVPGAILRKPGRLIAAELTVI